MKLIRAAEDNRKLASCMVGTLESTKFEAIGKLQNFGMIISHLGEISRKIKLLSTHYFVCRKFAVVC